MKHIYFISQHTKDVLRRCISTRGVFLPCPASLPRLRWQVADTVRSDRAIQAEGSCTTVPQNSSNTQHRETLVILSPSTSHSLSHSECKLRCSKTSSSCSPTAPSTTSSSPATRLIPLLEKSKRSSSSSSQSGSLWRRTARKISSELRIPAKI